MIKFIKNRLFIYCMLFLFGISMLLTITKKNEYRSNCILVPQYLLKDDILENLLGNLSSNLGVFSFSTTHLSVLPANAYPLLVNKEKFANQIKDQVINSILPKITFYDYYCSKNKPNLIDKIDYFLNNKSKFTSASDYYFYRDIEKNINVKISNDGTFEIEAISIDPILSYLWCNYYKKNFYEQLINITTRRARHDLGEIYNRKKETKFKLDSIRNSMAIFKDGNLNLSTEVAKIKLNKFSQETLLYSELLAALEQQYFLQEIIAYDRSKIFIELEPAQIDDHPINVPFYYVLIWWVLGITFFCGLILIIKKKSHE